MNFGVGIKGLGLGRVISSGITTPILAVSAGVNSAVAAITGDSDVTHYLYYKSSSNTAWQLGGSRQGDGNITVTGLSNDVPYIFIAYSIDANEIVSFPALAVLVMLSAEADNSLYDLLSDTASDFLVEFGESVKYLPSGGGSRTITAIVDREPPAELSGMSGAHSTLTIISVANNAVTGISSSEINTGGDKIELSVRINETVKQKRIAGIISQDSGMMRLEVR